MISYDIDRARDAIQYLVDDPFFARNIRKLRSQVKRPRAMSFKGDAECLNELLLVGRQSLQAMENMIAVAEFKRGTRNDYQREFMAQQRARERMVVKIEETLRGEKLALEERTQLSKAAQTQHMQERDVFLAEQYAAFTKRNGRGPTLVERLEIVKTFWEKITLELQAQLEIATKAAAARRKPAPKLVVVEKPEPKSVMAAAFKKVLGRKDEIERGKKP